LPSCRERSTTSWSLLAFIGASNAPVEHCSPRIGWMESRANGEASSVMASGTGLEWQEAGRSQCWWRKSQSGPGDAMVC
jgi:hypothetical protein